MANHFYGEAYESHYEKELKDFTPVDWATSIVYLLIIISAVVFGFLNNWGLMVIMAGVAVCMLHVFMLIVMKVNYKIVRYFFLLGLLVIIAGVITCTEHYEYLELYIIALYLLISFGVGILCLNLARKKRKKICEYTLSVEAECELVDVKEINLFRFDDIHSSSYNNPINDNVLNKPAFHYFVNGQEYYTESEVYYGDMNVGFEDGARVTLRVNPNNPTDVLPKNVGTFLEMVMGIGWIAIAVIVIIVLGICYYLGVF